MALLYKQSEAWGLPSVSPACIQVEAYLRFAETPFYVEVCSSSSRSPSGKLPAVEKDTLVSGLEPSSSRSNSALGNCFSFLKRHCLDLDTKLTVAQKAEVLAYTVLIQERLELAVSFSSWCDPRGFSQMRKALDLPFPLNYLIAWSEQHDVKRKHGHIKADQVYAQAEAAAGSIADRLAASPGPFFFGSQPCSLDAQLFGVLVYMLRSPTIDPALRQKVAELPALSQYVEYVMTEFFAEPAPRLTPEERAAWGATAEEASKGDNTQQEKPEATEAERQAARGNYLWLLGVGAASLLYVLVGGQHLKIAFRPAMLMPGGDMDDDEDGEEDEEEDG